jgi:hypothetical protein
MMTPGFAKSRQELFWLPYPEPDKVIINAHNFTPSAFDPSVNGKSPVAAWIESRDPEPTTSMVITDLVGTNDGTMTRMDPSTDRVANTEAGGTRAIDFDGVNDTVIASPIVLGTTLTVSVWLKRSAVVNNDGDVPVGSHIGHYAINFLGTGGWAYFDGTNFCNFATGITFVGNWRHLVVRRNAGSLEYIVDGVVIRTFTGLVGGSLNVDLLGAYSRTGLYPYRGLSDDVRIFDQYLDDTDVSDLWAGGAGRGVLV